VLSKGAVASVTIGAVTGALALGIFLCSCWKREDSGQDCGAAAPPYPHEMEDSSNPRARPGLIPGVVQPAPLPRPPGTLDDLSASLLAPSCRWGREIRILGGLRMGT